MALGRAAIARFAGVMTTTPHATALDRTDAWSRLRSRSLGRLAVSVDGHPDIFPVNFLATDDGILIRTEPGTKVDDVVANENVAFEVDDTAEGSAWSVVVKGTARRVDDEDHLAAARSAALWAWAPGPKDVFLHIDPTDVTGRLFSR